MRESEVLQRLGEELKHVLKMEFEYKDYAIRPKLAPNERDSLYRDRVAAILKSEEKPLPKLKKVWYEDDVSRFIESISFNMDRREDGKVGTMYVESELILYRRHRGISHMLWKKRDETYDYHSFPSTSPSFRLWTEKLEKEGEPSIRFLKAAADLAEKVADETRVDLALVKDILGIDDTVLPMFFVASCDLPYSAEETANEIMRMVKAVKQVWMKWLETRDRLCEELGMSDEIFAVRDVIENAFNLPLWTVNVRPGKRGAEVFIDPGFLESRRKAPYELSPGLIWNPLVPWLQVEFDEASPEKPVYVYSPPTGLGCFMEEIIIIDKGGEKSQSLEEIPGASEASYELLKRMKELNANPLEYLTDRKRLREIETISPLLARKMEELIRFLEESREKFGEVVLYPIDHADSPLSVWTINPEKYTCNKYVHTIATIDFSLRLKFHRPKDYRIIKECPQWILQCLETYEQVGKIFQEF